MILMLIGFGVRAMYQGVCRGPSRPTHSHANPRPSQTGRWQIARRPLVVGAVHGLAGSGALTALVVTTLPSTVTRLGYLALFGVGTTVGRAALSGLPGDRPRPAVELPAHRAAVLTPFFKGRQSQEMHEGRMRSTASRRPCGPSSAVPKASVVLPRRKRPQTKRSAKRR